MRKEAFATKFALELSVIVIAGFGIGYSLVMEVNLGSILIFIAGLLYAIGIRLKSIKGFSASSIMNFLGFGIVSCGIGVIIGKGASIWILLVNIGALLGALWALSQRKG